MKLAQTEDEIRQKTAKAFREIGASQEALQTAGEMVELRQLAQKKAMEAPDLTALLKVSKDLALAQIDSSRRSWRFGKRTCSS